MKSVKVTKLSRALDLALTPKAAKGMERRPHPPGQHGKNKRPSQSIYSRQLREKQRLKAQYHISEKQLKNYFKTALKTKGVTGTALLKMLEQRLDVTVLRAGFAPTIYAARQLVSHGHIILNGRRVTKAGAAVSIGSSISIAARSRNHLLIKDTFPSAVRPEYIQANLENFSASKTRDPERNEIPVICEEQLIVELYSR